MYVGKIILYPLASLWQYYGYGPRRGNFHHLFGGLSQGKVSNTVLNVGWAPKATTSQIQNWKSWMCLLLLLWCFGWVCCCCRCGCHPSWKLFVESKLSEHGKHHLNHPHAETSSQKTTTQLPRANWPTLFCPTPLRLARAAGRESVETLRFMWTDETPSLDATTCQDHPLRCTGSLHRVFHSLHREVVRLNSPPPLKTPRLPWRSPVFLALGLVDRRSIHQIPYYISKYTYIWSSYMYTYEWNRWTQTNHIR